MILGVVPGNSTAALRPSPTQPRPRPSLTDASGGRVFRLVQWPGAGGGWTRLSSSAFRARAAVGEGAKARCSFYELLGIPESGSFDDIKRAYKQMALKYHPDVSPPDLAEEYTRRFIEVQEAYETLSDPRLRALYDRDLARGLHLAFSARRRVDEVDLFVTRFFRIYFNVLDTVFTDVKPDWNWKKDLVGEAVGKINLQG
ncbi:hypothetical protein C4D60_Mb03t17630 [Musa balbisiana]|uniref:J domain-containing protein n=1 Tax=Musa balbisiana TaxID=52838 RepID=A0A4S8JAK0_MUSBA|nr:hypothetical protein C4D60_Mb03t17630 [Musa balbisiana]